MKILKSLLLLTMLTTAAIAMAAETGTALKADSLRTEPYADAKSSGSLSRGDKLEILAKQGAWLKVKTARSSGWVRLLSVKRNSGSGNQVAGVLNLASGRSGTGQVVSTTGVRGLSEEDLKAAKFNEAEVKALEGYTQSAEQSQKFAGNGGLKPIKLGYLPAPAGNSSGSSSTQTGESLLGGNR